MNKFREKRVVIVGGGQSGRLLAKSLQEAGAANDAVTVLSARPSSASGVTDGAEATCVSIAEHKQSIQAQLADGRALEADAVVLATGCMSFRRTGDEHLESPRDHLGLRHIRDRRGRIVVLGSGSEAVRFALQAIDDGHLGKIDLVSPAGLVPLRADGEPPLDLMPADIPFGTGLRYLMQWVRGILRWGEERGISASAVLGGLKPHVPRIWQHLTQAERRRFVMHLHPLWSVLREDLRPQEFSRFTNALGRQVSVINGRYVRASRTEDGVRLHIRDRQTLQYKELDVVLAINCEDAPPGRDIFASPIISALISRGLARPDTLCFGLDVSDDCALVDRQGRVSQRLYAIGAPTRGRFVDALDLDRIRAQSKSIAHAILRNSSRKAA